jgi:TPR repeat
MRLRGRLRTFALLAFLAAEASTGSRFARAEETNGANVAAARRHFEKARADYAQGSYREAIAELEAAHTLDPTAKDLVFNLGVVHEKLSDIDDALTWFHLYTTMSLTPQERDRADAYIRRLEGAKKEVDRHPAEPPAVAPPPAPSPDDTPLAAPAAPAPGAPRYGRIDAATVVAAGVAVAGLAFGTILAIKAKTDQPPTGFVTGRDGSYADLVDATHLAHREAIFADVGFGVSLAAGITAVVLYFARAPDPPAGPQTVTSRTLGAPDAPRISAVPLPGGAAFVLQGSL